MSLLIVGAGGFIGRSLLKAASRTGISVHGVSSADGTGLDAQTGLLRGDFEIPRGTDVVVYLSQSPWYQLGSEMAHHAIAVNLLSAVRLAELSRRSGVRRFIYSSTGNVYAPSFKPLSESDALRRDNWYSLTKVHGEEAVSLFRNDMEIIVTRPFGVYGPGQHGRLVPNMVHAIASGRRVEITRNPNDCKDLDGLKISLCHVRDAVQIYLSLIEKGGPLRLNLAGERPISIRELATTLGVLMNRDVAFELIERARDTDLVADTTLLSRHVPITYTTLAQGLRDCIAIQPELQQ